MALRESSVSDFFIDPLVVDAFGIVADFITKLVDSQRAGRGGGVLI